MIETVGRYELLEEIGQGGFAIVYRARDTVLDRVVALKELKPTLLGDTAWVERFRREARTIARLDHPRIVPIYDVEEIEQRLFIVMRLINGPNLKELIATRGRLSWGEAVEIVAAVSEGLDYAHAQNFLHRDLKPANILLDPERGPLLSDFGMAKLVGDSSISATGSIVGTPHYIAPEVWEGEAVTPQVDIYALACILYELLMGGKIFQGQTPLAVMNAHLKPIELPAVWPWGVPPGVADVFHTALARQPSERYTTSGQMAQALAMLTVAESPPPDDLLAISTFGGLRLTLGGNRVTEVGSRRVEALLVYLACAGRTQPREVLADLLWDDRPQQQAMSNLRTILTGLRKHFNPYVAVSRETVTLNPASNLWLDVTEVNQALTQTQDPFASPETVAQVENAVALYRGDFLEGFHLRGARNFADWLSIEREHLRQQVLDALAELAAYHLAQGSYKAGIVHARHLLQLDPLLEETHQQLMRLLAFSGQRVAALEQYETCCRIMEEEFGLEPTAETTALFAQIQAGTLETPPAAPTPAPAVTPQLKLPDFLREDRAPPITESPVFVARERELAKLAEYLTVALAGQGHVVFVTGEAGRGKTALLTEFTRRAQEVHDNLIVAGGHCNAYAGSGDPYLPFRDVLGMLSGDVESKWAVGAISRDHARCLWTLLPHTVQALVDEGPDLVDVFVSGRSLVKRASAGIIDHADCLSRLQELVNRERAAPGDLEQRQLFEQYTQVLKTLAAHQPLLLWVDDLQWADSASLNLLFHLGRRLVGSRILIVGAYRPSEVTLGSAVGDTESLIRNGLEPVVNEFKRLFGDIQVDLGQIPPAESRAFVDALLDSEPNRLGETFRQALFAQTKGHPLFTIELLRDMQARGDLVPNAQGQWIEGAALDWQALPTRVEAVIEQRLARLDEELQDILAVASVEGEVFTVQVVAHVQGVNERRLLRRLTRELSQRHRLVREQGEVTVGSHRLTRYRFGHALFQQYLYDQLGQTERRLLHRDVAELLEGLYTGHTDEVATQLARHYVAAGEGEKALEYLLQAGDQTRLAYAHEVAIDFYRQALTILKDQGDYERAVRTLMKLGLTYHNAFDFEQSRQAYEEGFALWQQVDKPQHTPVYPLPPAPHPLRIGGGIQPPTLDWIKFKDTNLDMLVNQLFSGLVRMNPEMELVPDVAQSWEILEGGQKFIFHLRNDVVWSDGTPVTAGDFEYAWMRILEPTTTISETLLLYDIKGARAFHRGELSTPDQIGVYALDEITLVVELEKPIGYFLNVLTKSITYPVPRHVVAVHPENWTDVDKIVTNGPFKLKVWDPSGLVVFSRNPAYHGQFTGNATQIEFIAHQNPSATEEMYTENKLDIIGYPIQQLEQALQHRSEEYVSVPDLAVFFVEFDVNRPPFNDPQVRRAFVLATDKDRLANEIMQGTVLPATGGFVPVGIPGHSAEIGLPYDPEQARHLLTKAGYPDGQNFPVIDFLIWPRLLPTCEDLLAQWRENLGVEVRLEVVEWTEIFERRSNNPSYLHLYGWDADYPDPDSFLRVAFEATIRWRDETYDRLVTEAGRITDQQQRLTLYQQADKILIDEAAILPLTHTCWTLLVKPWIKRLPSSVAGWWHFEDVIIDPSLKPVQQMPAILVPTESRVLRLAWHTLPSLDPALSDDGASQGMICQLFSGLVEESPTLGITPDVAQWWEVLDDGCKYVFHLRDDVFWSDGTPVTASDFVYAWQRALNPRTGSRAATLLYDVKGAEALHQGDITDPNEVGVSALDETTLLVELARPTSYFLQLLTLGVAYPIPQHIVERYGTTWAHKDHLVTNGPFKLEAWQPGESMTLARNPAYHGQSRGNVQRIEITVLVDWSPAVKMYEADQLDSLIMTGVLSMAQMNYLRQQYPADHISNPVLVTRYVGFNVSKPPFEDARVRQAVAMAIDKEILAHVILGGYHAPARGGYIPPGMWGHSADVGWLYNPARSRQLLAEAGYPNGHGFPPLVGLTDFNELPSCENLQTQWRENLGIDIAWKGVAWAEYLATLRRDQPHLFMQAWSADYPDPNNFLTVGLSRETGWHNNTYTRLVEQARQSMSQQERGTLYQQADQLLMHEAAIVPLIYEQFNLLAKPWLKNVRQSLTYRLFWKDVIIEPH